MSTSDREIDEKKQDFQVPFTAIKQSQQHNRSPDLTLVFAEASCYQVTC